MQELDSIRLNFSSDSLVLLNTCLAIIMFGIALEVRFEEFKHLWTNPKSALVGLASQFLVLPFLSYILILLIEPQPSVALGMILVAACPGGNISNFIANLSNANAALSVGLTSISTFLSLIMTPLNFQFYGSLYEPSSVLLHTIELDVLDLSKTVLLIIILPLTLGILVQNRYSFLAQKIAPYFKFGSILIFIAFVVIAFMKNIQLFLDYIHYVLGLVFIHNLLALLTGFGIASVFKLASRDKRTLAIETGIQNSGLALVLIFTFFEGLGGMAMVAAWWGIWHIISGLILAFVWSRKSLKIDTLELNNSL
jgi:BASS family bile acid:Na+ symporter